VWTVRTGAWVASSPAVANGIVYVGGFDHRVYALRATDGAAVWQVTLGASVQASPSAANGVVYVVAQDGIVHELNAATGADVAPPFATGAPIIVSSPAVSDNEAG
jgi:outer membrane protein assembly factor BamB